MGVLVLLSIVLITIYFRESSGGALHSVQGAGATVLRPFEIVAERVARPFRDAGGYFSGLFGAKSENKRLHAEVDQLRQQLTQNVTAAGDNRQLMRLLHFRNSASYPAGFGFKGARIISRPSPALEQQVAIDIGKTSGVQKYDPVVGSDGLVGSVTNVYRDVAQVTLLTDDTSAVSAVDAQTRAPGIVKTGSSGKMSFDEVSKDRRVSQGDTLVTAGWKAGGLSSIYPPNIPIGTVDSVGQNEVDLYKHVQLKPFTDFGSLSYVLVVVKPGR